MPCTETRASGLCGTLPRYGPGGGVRTSLDERSERRPPARRAARSWRRQGVYRHGLRATRPQLTALLDYVREGDTLTVWRLDRLGRSLPELLKLMAVLNDRGIAFRSLTEGMDTTPAAG